MNNSKPEAISLPLYQRSGEIAAFIKAHCVPGQTSLKIKCLSKQFALSPTQLKKAFKDRHQQTLHQFVIQEKMRQAAELLVTHSPKEVSIMTGYNDLSNFSRDFKKYIGCSPRSYKASVVEMMGNVYAVNYQ